MASAISKHNMRDPRHLMRHAKFRLLTGSDAERLKAIAKSEGVSVETVKASVRQIETFNARNDDGQVTLAMNEAVINMMPKFQESIVGLLGATELVEVPDGNTGKNKVVKQDDKTTRLEASRIVKDIIVAKQPKVPMVEVNNNQTNQVAVLSTAETQEERMDRLRKRAAAENLLPAEVAAVPGYLDRDEEPDDDGEEEGDEEESE